MRHPHHPLHAMLSQALVAFTIELDNEFERRLREAGYSGARLSLVVWTTFMRFLDDADVSVRDLAARSLTPEPGVKVQLGSLERWGFVSLLPEAGGDPAPLRDGWGSGRGIRAGWTVRLTAKGRRACGIWPALLDEIGQRWRDRFGEEHIDGLCQTLESILEQLDNELPQGLPVELLGTRQYPRRTSRQSESLPLPALLSQALLAFAMEFDRESFAPLQLCANTLRVLRETPVPVSELPRLTGCSPETCGLGWQLKRYVAVAADPAAKRGKAVRLTALGLEAQRRYREVTREIESRWEGQLGVEMIGRLRRLLESLFEARRGERLLLVDGLRPPEGTVRSGTLAPALGRRDIGAAARQRMRDLVAQTGWFLEDPAGALPHYPLWDHNRGYGP